MSKVEELKALLEKIEGNFKSTVLNMDEFIRLAKTVQPDPTPDPDPDPEPPQGRLTPYVFNPQSPIYKKIPVDAVYKSTKQIGAIRQSHDDYCAPVYKTKPGDPVKTFRNRESGRAFEFPVPAETRAARGSDGHCIILSDEASCEVWQPNPKNFSTNTINCGGNVIFPRSKNGISDPINYRVTAGGFSRMATTITDIDIINGRLEIEHLIGIACPPASLADKVIFPAVGYETKASNNVDGLPCGAIVALKRNADIPDDIHPFTLALVKNLQEYGMVVMDSNSAQPFKGTPVANFGVQPGLFEKLYGTSGNLLMERVASEMYEIIRVNGLYTINV